MRKLHANVRVGWVLVAVAASAGCGGVRPPAASLNERALLYQLRTADREAEGAKLGPDAAAALALVQNPELRARRLEKKLAAGAVISANALKNPELRASLEEFLSGGPLRLATALRIFPPVPGEQEAAVERAKAREAQVAAELEAAEGDVVAKTLLTHAELVAVEKKLELYAASAKVHDRLVAMVEERVQARVATRLDLAIAKLKRSNVEEKARELELDHDLAEAKLAALLGVAGVSLQVSERTATSTEAGARLALDQDALEELALDARADLVALRHGWEARDARVRQRFAETGLVPRFVEPGLSRLGDRPRLDVATAIELPIFDDGRAAIAEAEVERDQAAAAITARLQAVRLDIRAALAEIRRADARRRRFDTELVPMLAEAEALVTEGLATRALDPLDLETIGARVLDARVTAVDVALDRRKAEIALARATGTVLDVVP